MARAKRCEEEFNPWPPFVDVFSSVVLVLLLFILVLIVNVAYYTQFNTKVDSTAETKSVKNNLQAGMDVSDMISLFKVPKPSLDSSGNDSLFSGGKADGQGMDSDEKQKKGNEQAVEEVSGSAMIIAYKDSNIFLRSKAKAKIKSFAKKAKDKKVVISMAYPTNIISTTMKKRISISRVINVKNSLKKAGIKLSNIKIVIQNNSDEKYPDGYVKIEIK
jgi:biopolymer transport protein ExbD